MEPNRELTFMGWVLLIGTGSAIFGILIAAAVLLFHRPPNMSGIVVGAVGNGLFQATANFLRKNIK